jgi:membrane protein DedA with SNARE-associated domain
METLTALLSAYQLPTVFAGAFFFGDSVILTSAYVAGQLSWSPLPLFAAAFFGTILSDTLWYLFGAKGLARFSGIRFFKKERAKMSGFVQRLVGERPLAALIMVKFLYGSRIAMILYVASRGMPLARFTLFNAIGAVIWLLVFIPLGYLAGMGIGQAFPYVNVIPTAIVVLIISVIVFRVITIWMEKKTNE